MKQKRRYLIWSCLLLVLILAFFLAERGGVAKIIQTTYDTSQTDSSAWKASVSSQKKSASQKNVRNGSFQMDMLDVGQGLCLLIRADGKTAVYDGGGRDRSSYVVRYLKNHEIDELDYMFVSHYDEDHIAGLVGILNTTKVDRVICPDYSTDTKIYQSFLRQRKENGAKVTHPSEGDEFQLGNAVIEVVGTGTEDEDNDNNNSIAIRISYGDFSAMITGDAEKEEETAIVQSNTDIESDLYVVGHHGSSSSTSTAFLRAVAPQYAWISAGTDNSYGHPTRTTLKLLKQEDVDIFRTDDQGEVTCYSDGTTCWFSENPSDDWQSGEEKRESEGQSSQAVTTYILNTNTKKFHDPDCGSVRRMSEKNKETFTGTREQIISEGYDPCGNCHP